MKDCDRYPHIDPDYQARAEEHERREERHLRALDYAPEAESIRFQGARHGNFGGWLNFLYQLRFTNCVSCWPGSAR